MKHLVFYDGTCGFCSSAVQWILKRDKQEIFAFSPLQGETAKTMLKDLPDSVKDVDSLILVENYESPSERRYYILGKGALRISWLLGGVWSVCGALSFLPSAPADLVYRFIAKHRHHLFGRDVCVIPKPEERHRFLP